MADKGQIPSWVEQTAAQREGSNVGADLQHDRVGQRIGRDRRGRPEHQPRIARMAGMEAKPGIFGDHAAGGGDLHTEAHDRRRRVVGQSVPCGQVGRRGVQRRVARSAHDEEVAALLDQGAGGLAQS